MFTSCQEYTIGIPHQQVSHPRIRKADCVFMFAIFCIAICYRDLSIHEFWYQWGLLEAIPCGYRGVPVLQTKGFVLVGLRLCQEETNSKQ